MKPVCSVQSTAVPPVKAPLTVFAATDTTEPTQILSRCLAQVRIELMLLYMNLNLHFTQTHAHRKSLWFKIWTFWHIYISHPQADELWDQRTVVVYVTPNRETLSEPSLTRTRRWHAHSVAVHRSDPTHKARLPLLNITQPVLQAGPEVTGPGRVALWRGRPGEWAQARLSLVMPMKLFEFEFEFEADTEVERKRVGRIDQRKGERWGVGVKREGKTRRKEWRRRVSLRERERGCVYLRKLENRCTECGLTKTKRGWARKKKAPFNVLVVFFPHSASLPVERKRGGKRFDGLQQRRFA